MPGNVHSEGRILLVFVHVNADKAGLYRAVLRVFMEAKAAFALHLRPADVATVEEFYRPRFVYQLTAEGEAAERAQTFQRSLQRTMDLHGITVAAFLDYKQTLIDYLERCIARGESLFDHCGSVRRRGGRVARAHKPA